eukprot:RCo041414
MSTSSFGEAQPLLPASGGARARLLSLGLGYVCLSWVILFWVVQSEAAQCLQRGGCLGVREAFNKPYFMTWWDHNGQAAMVPLCGVVRLARSRRLGHSSEGLPLSCAELASLSVFLSAVYFIGDYVWFLGLPYISVSLGTALVNCSCVFVFILSVMLLGEEVTISKVLP